MLNEAIRDIGYKHNTKKGQALLEAIDNELAACKEFVKKHEEFLPKNLKKWFQKSVIHSDRAYDYLDRFVYIKIREDSMTCGLECKGRKSFSYISLQELVIELLRAHDGYRWYKLLFYDSS